jgi:hypothetical protein
LEPKPGDGRKTKRKARGAKGKRGTLEGKEGEVIFKV